MPNKEYINFIALMLFNYRAKHIWIAVISSLLVFIIASTLFVSGSVKNDAQLTLREQSDFIVQRYRAGKVEDAPQKWVEEFNLIDGVGSAAGRVYGMHFYEPSETYFMIVGVDFFDTAAVGSLKKLLEKVDVAEFLSKDNMIIGRGVKELFDYYEYKGSYNFRPPDRGIKKVFIYDVLPKESRIITNDIVIMDIALAREILGLKEGYVTDIAIDVPNPLELSTVRTKLIVSHFDVRIISKADIAKIYENMFNYKGGFFLTLYILSLVTFLLILYQRYSTVVNNDAKGIAILRISGWNISDVIWLKLTENFIIALGSYMTGVIAAYVYVYIFSAPLLREIFLGYNNLRSDAVFSPIIDTSMLVLVFLIFVVPFMLSVLIPVWRISIREPYEALR